MSWRCFPSTWKTRKSNNNHKDKTHISTRNYLASINGLRRMFVLWAWRHKRLNLLPSSREASFSPLIRAMMLILSSYWEIYQSWVLSMRQKCAHPLKSYLKSVDYQNSKVLISTPKQNQWLRSWNLQCLHKILIRRNLVNMEALAALTFCRQRKIIKTRIILALWTHLRQMIRQISLNFH